MTAARAICAYVRTSEIGRLTYGETQGLPANIRSGSQAVKAAIGGCRALPPNRRATFIKWTFAHFVTLV